MISLFIDSSKKLDSYFLDVSSEGIIIPSSTALFSVYASLRMKHDVLILTNSVIPEVDFKKRFNLGDQFIHLSPRFLTYLIDNYSRQPLNFQHFKDFLINCK